PARLAADNPRQDHQLGLPQAGKPAPALLAAPAPARGGGRGPGPEPGDLSGTGQREVVHGEGLRDAGRGADLEAEVDLPQLVAGGQVAAGYQVLDPGHQIDRACGRVVVQDEGVVPARLVIVPGETA